MEVNMTTQEMALQQQKKELTAAQERTEAGKFYSPYTDIIESENEVLVSMEVPGVDKAAIDIQLEKGVLTVTANIDSRKYEDLEPIYTEYNVGNFVRSFTLSTKIDSAKIAASVADGVLTVRLPKAAEALPRRIEIR
jgi:HSP20 family protein